MANQPNWLSETPFADDPRSFEESYFVVSPELSAAYLREMEQSGPREFLEMTKTGRALGLMGEAYPGAPAEFIQGPPVFSDEELRLMNLDLAAQGGKESGTGTGVSGAEGKALIPVPDMDAISEYWYIIIIVLLIVLYIVK